MSKALFGIAQPKQNNTFSFYILRMLWESKNTINIIEEITGLRESFFQ